MTTKSRCHPGAETGAGTTHFGKLKRLLAVAIGDSAGGVVLTFALVLPVLLLTVGAAIDYGFLYSKRTSLQTAADASALGAARELHVANADHADIIEVAKSIAKPNLADMPGEVDVQVKVSDNPLIVAVEITQSPGLYFMDHVTGDEQTVIRARAIAKVSGGTPICVLGLHPSESQTIMLQSGALLNGNKCSVYSNSSHSMGIMSQRNSYTEAELICTGGGYSGGSDNYKPMPVTECPYIDDPLSSRETPIAGICTYESLVIEYGERTLSPGTYCGGLTITDEAAVKLQPGIYIIKDGPLLVGGRARMWGENVGFYLLGDDAVMGFAPLTKIELTAPAEGPMAGLLVFEDRDAPLDRMHQIRSNDARLLIGTFYFPRGNLIIDTTEKVADKSAYTAIVAQRLKLFSGPHLVLNANYDATEVPAPLGESGEGPREIVLAQ